MFYIHQYKPGTFNASVSGESGSSTTKWYIRNDNQGGSWIEQGSWQNDRNVSYTAPGNDFSIKCYIIWSNGSNETDIRSVTINAPLDLSIYGPAYVDINSTNSYTAMPQDGTGSYTNYEWWRRNDGFEIKGTPGTKAPPIGEWMYMSFLAGQKTVNITSANWDFSLKCRVTDSNNDTATEIRSICISGSKNKEGGKAGSSLSRSMPECVTLIGNYPNPFNPTTVIKFGIPEKAHVKLQVYTITGKLVAELLNGEEWAGYHEVHWNLSNSAGGPLASGLYIYRLIVGKTQLTGKMLYKK
ncbi:T9SS type A sorting domain-containing protein [bacterium]|nr:T9SS type A sorting domain-containing protein [bacterium]